MSVLWLIVSVCEWWFATAVCANKTVSFFLLSYIILFSKWVNVCDCCQLTWLPEAASGCPVLSANTPMSSRLGGPAASGYWEPPAPVLSSPITEQNLAPRTSSKHTANGTFIYLPSCNPFPQHPSFTGIRGAISRSPIATVVHVSGGGRGDNFLMMSPCHGDWQSVAKKMKLVLRCQDPTGTGFW